MHGQQPSLRSLQKFHVFRGKDPKVIGRFSIVNFQWNKDAAQSTRVHAGVVPALTHLSQLSTHKLINQQVESGEFEQEKHYALEVVQETARWAICKKCS